MVGRARTSRVAELAAATLAVNGLISLYGWSKRKVYARHPWVFHHPLKVGRKKLAQRRPRRTRLRDVS